MTIELELENGEKWPLQGNGFFHEFLTRFLKTEKGQFTLSSYNKGDEGIDSFLIFTKALSPSPSRQLENLLHHGSRSELVAEVQIPHFYNEVRIWVSDPRFQTHLENLVKRYQEQSPETSYSIELPSRA